MSAEKFSQTNLVSSLSKSDLQFDLQKLLKIIEEKIASGHSHSYSYQLFCADFSKIAQKIGEEGVEVALAAVINGQNQNSESRQNLIGEICDLFYHLLVLLAKSNISLLEILLELEKRNGIKN